jgi:hypothetical protein
MVLPSLRGGSPVYFFFPTGLDGATGAGFSSFGGGAPQSLLAICSPAFSV